jgi:hypothetical protein
MKKITKILTFGLILFGLQFGNAQIFKKLKKKLEKKVDKVEQKIADKLDEKVDNELDSLQIFNKKSSSKDSVATASKMPKFSNSSSVKALDKYVFRYETVVKVNPPEQNEAFKVSYLLQPEVEYMGLKVDLSEYGDGNVEGESIIIFDGEQNFAFVNASGRKMQMSISQMGNNNVGNPAENMKNYDYTKPEKTGRTKTILGKTCYEYVMSDDQASIQLWIAPDVDIPNWFIQNNDVLDGHIMAYRVESSDGIMTSETIEIKTDVNKVINSNEYKKMF